MSKPVRLHPLAERELLDATAWYRDQREALAEELLAEIDGVLADLGERADSRPPAPDAPAHEPPVRQALLRRFRYRLVFVERAADVFVLAVAHLAQEPGYWQGRLA